MKYGGHFETQVYHIEMADQFLIIDCRAKPTAESWVMVRCPSATEIIIEPFRGQPHLGVAQMLEFYQLPQSEQDKAGLNAACPG